MKNASLTTIIFLGVTYTLLVMADYGLARYLSYLKSENKKENVIVLQMKKYLKSQQWAVDEAKNDGYEYIFNPYAVDHYPITKVLARELRYAPPGGKPNQKTFWCDEGYGLVTYTSDRFGFRNEDFSWDEPVQNIFIGDSFTAGACVDVDTSFVGLFKSANGNTINLSTGGNTPIHYASLAKRFISKIEPKRAFMVFYANDNFDGSPGEMNSVYYDLYMKGRSSSDQNASLFWQEAEPFIDAINSGFKPSFVEKGHFLERFKKYLKLPTMRNVLNKSLASHGFSRDLHFTSRLAINTLIEECDNVGCEPIIVYIPSSAKWQPGLSGDGYSRKLREYASSRGLTFIDTTLILKADGEENSYAPYGGHLSPEGNYRVMQMLTKQL